MDSDGERAMSKIERLAAAAICGLLMLWVGLVDIGDPTPPAIRWPIVALAAVARACSRG